MKKLLLKSVLLLCALITGTSAWADNVIFNFQQNTEDYGWDKTPANSTDFAVNDVLTNGVATFTYTAKGSGTTNLRWWNTTDGLRSYNGNKFKIAVSSGTINSITFTGTCVLTESSSTGGTYSNRTWTKPNAGNITEVEFECSQSSGNKTIQRITVSVAAPPSSDPSSNATFTNKTPSLDLKDGSTYTQTVTTAAGYAGTVTYSIGATNTAGATINSSTGQVTVTKAGSVVVEASAAAVVGSWAASSDSYTLTVADNRSNAGIYWDIKDTEIELGATSGYTLPTLVNPNSLAGITYEITGTAGMVSESAGVISVDTSIKGEASVKAIYAGGTHKPSTVTCTIAVYDPTEQGTKYVPYSVADIIAFNPTSTSTAKATGKYVVGYILGSCVGSGDNAGDLLDTDVESNMILADDPAETDKDNFISVQLPSGAIRTALNVVDHPYYKRCVKVLLKGDVYKYCGIPGLKNLSSEKIVGQSIKVTAAGLSTYCTDVNLKFDGTLEAYIAKEEGGDIKLYQVTNVPANTPVLLRAPGIAADTYFDVVVTEDADDVTDNTFKKGTDAAVATGTGPYNWILSKKVGVLGFYHANGNIVAKNRAYLQTTTASARILLDFDNVDVTAIENVEVQKANGQFFNLAGQRVAQPTKGLYIVNGKKVVIK